MTTIDEAPQMVGLFEECYVNREWVEAALAKASRLRVLLTAFVSVHAGELSEAQLYELLDLLNEN